MRIQHPPKLDSLRYRRRASLDRGLSTRARISEVDAELPDDPGAGIQQQVQAGSSAPPPADTTCTGCRPACRREANQAHSLVIPNFRAVSADQHLPPQTVKEKFKTAMLDSLDYSSFIFVAGQAGVAQADNSYPEFGQGAKGYGRYYWHTLADAINENTGSSSSSLRSCIRTRGITPWARETLANGWAMHSRAS